MYHRDHTSENSTELTMPSGHHKHYNIMSTIIYNVLGLIEYQILFLLSALKYGFIIVILFRKG